MLAEIFINDFWDKIFLGNKMSDYLIAFGIFLISYIIIKICIKFSVSKLEKIVEKTKNTFDDLLFDVLSNLPDYFFLLISLYFPIKSLIFSDTVHKVWGIIFLIGVLFEVMIIIGKVAVYLLSEFLEKKGKKDDTTVNMFKVLIKMAVSIVFIILALMTLGIAVTPLLASLGVMSVAFAFAFQKILEDIFSAFSIYMDKPFKIGEYISTVDFNGTIKRIGIKSTRITSLSGEEIVIPNKDLVNTQIHNYAVLKKRRVLFVIGVTYETPTAKLKSIPEIIKKIFDKIEDADLDRVHFKSFGDFSLNFEIVYFVLDKDYKVYAEKEHEINISIKEQFEKEGIEFAYPTQVLYVKK